MALDVREINWLKEIPLFSALNDSHLAKLSEIFIEHRYENGEEIIREGEIGNLLYIIKSGSVNVFRKSNSGEEIYLTVLGEKHYFGETVLFLENTPRSSTLKAAEKTVCIAVEREKFLQFLHDNTEPSVDVLISLIKEIFRRMYELGQELAYQRQGGMSQDEIDKFLK